MAAKSGKMKKAKGTRTLDTHEKDGLIEELKARNLVLEKELESRQEDFRAQIDELHKEKDERENQIRGRKQAEEALRESQKRLSLAQQVARIGTFEWNIQTGVNKWTPELEAMYGLPRGGFPGTEEAWEQLVYTEDRPETLRRVNEAIEKGGFEGEWRVIWPDGTVHWLYGRAFVFKDETGKPLKLIGINIDITGRKQMEEELRRSRYEIEQRVQERTRELQESEAMLAKSQEMTHIGSWVWDVKTGEISRTAESYRIFGLVPGEYMITYEKFLGFIVPEDRGRVANEIKSSLEYGTPYDITYRIRRKDGAIRILQSWGETVKDEDGRVVTVYGTNQDITERKRAEKRIANLASFPELNPNPIFEVGIDGLVGYANHAAKQLFPDLAVLRTDHPVLSGFDAIVGDLRGGKSYLVRDIKFKDTYLQQTINLVPDSGTVRFYILDITERKRAEEALRDSQTHLSSIFRAAPTGIGVVVDRVIKEVNDQLCEMTGYNSEELLGKSARIFYPSDEDYQYVGQEKYSQISLRGTGSVETRWLRKDGRIIDVLLSSTPLEPGNLGAGVTFTALDITKRKRAEEALIAAKTDAELYLDLMGHDISNMHQIILGNLELAQGILEFEGRLESGNKELIDTSIATLQRSAKLIENIRNIQKLRQGELESEATDLGEVLDRTVKGYSDLPDRDVSVSYEPVRGCYVMANVLLKEIFDNLIDNSVKHCDDPVRIGVSVTPAELDGRRYYRVVVEDNGRGIPDKMKSSVFTRLERGETKTRGTGLGLYIVKMLVEGFGGTVSVEDRVPGDRTKGARFVVLLPAAD
ncbi:MAG: PAS domain-containing protein [Methanocella sp.]